MSPFKLTWSFLSVPRLFCSLILFPFLLSLGIVLAQATLSTLFLATGRGEFTPEAINKKKVSQEHPVRRALLGENSTLRAIEICDWNIKKCDLEKYDVVIRPEILKNTKIESYIKYVILI
jgi:hypothetical protein